MGTYDSGVPKYVVFQDVISVYDTETGELVATFNLCTASPKGLRSTRLLTSKILFLFFILHYYAVKSSRDQNVLLIFYFRHDCSIILSLELILSFG